MIFPLSVFIIDKVLDLPLHFLLNASIVSPSIVALYNNLVLIFVLFKIFIKNSLLSS